MYPVKPRIDSSLYRANLQGHSCRLHRWKGIITWIADYFFPFLFLPFSSLSLSAYLFASSANFMSCNTRLVSLLSNYLSAPSTRNMR